VATDPFSMVYTALWEMMEARDAFKSLVLLKNRIKFDSETDRDPIKTNVATADLPEVMLLTNGINEINLYDSSSGSMVVRQYSWMISTGDYRLTEFLLPVEFELFRGMLDWQTKLTALQWCNREFVKRCNYVAASEGFSDPEANRNIEGWSSLWQCEVEMHFVTADLRNTEC
jgi:hypothetical protein